MENIICKKCKISKEIANYYFSYKGVLLKGGVCKQCISKMNNKRVLENKKIKIDNFLKDLSLLKDEEWKPVKNYENMYLVSSKGRICLISGKKSPIFMKVFYRKKDNYGSITFFDKKRKYIHRVVAETFIKNENNLPDVNHINGDKRNNCIENLEWCTTSENNIHMYKVLGYKGSLTGIKGKNHPSSHKVNQLDLEGNMIKEWSSLTEIKEFFNLKGTSYITKACKEGTILNGYRWKYNDKQ